MINKYGKHYCQTDACEKKRKKTFLKNYGVTSPLKSEKVKKKRERTNLEKYGVKHVSQDPSIRKNQKAGMMKNHGVEYSLQIPEAKEKLKNTLLEKYHVPSLAYLSHCASKESQRLFEDIQIRLPQEIALKSHFASLNSEFVIKYGINYYKYDFINSKLKKGIEYNGSNFHPKEDQHDEDINWCAFHPNKTVKEARDYEKTKYKALQERGYKILTIWDVECKKDYASVVSRCIAFLLQN